VCDHHRDQQLRHRTDRARVRRRAPDRHRARETQRPLHRQVAGIPCFREGKVKRLDAWLSARGKRLADFAESTLYSDSHNDLALLERVTRPVAVDPDKELAAAARERGWAVMSLRR